MCVCVIPPCIPATPSYSPRAHFKMISVLAFALVLTHVHVALGDPCSEACSNEFVNSCVPFKCSQGQVRRRCSAAALFSAKCASTAFFSTLPPSTLSTSFHRTAQLPVLLVLASSKEAQGPSPLPALTAHASLLTP